MFTTTQIIPFLEYADGSVRTLALRYLSDAHDPSPATAEDIWRMIDRHGGGPHNANYLALALMPHTQASLTRTLKARAETPDAKVRTHLENALGRVSHGLLVRFADLIEQASLSPDLREHLRLRIELAATPPTELWDRLMQHAEQVYSGEQAWSESDPRIAARLVEALSRSPESAQWAIALLNDESIIDLREVYAVDVLGMMRFAPGTELLVKKLASDDDADFLLESSTNALVRVGSTQVIHLIAEQFRKMTWGIRLHATDVLRRIKIPQSETAAAQLLGQEPAIDIQTLLAGALCELGTNQSSILEKLDRMVRDGQWDEMILDLHEDMVALCTMLGRTPPKAPKEPVGAAAPFFNDLKEDEELEWADDDLMSDLAPPPAQAAPVPIRRTSPKIGRNDPCPCGSGKKYKKCCGK